MSVYKHREFVAYVEEHEDITPAALGEYFGVSERTVRTYVSRSNKSLGGCARVIKRRGDGYHIQIEDPTGFAHWKSRDRLQAPNAIPSTHEERVRFVLNDLLSRAGWITLDQLASILYVSHNTVSNDMHEVEEKLGRYGLELQRKPYYASRKRLRIARRRCMAISPRSACSINSTSPIALQMR
jgi:lichenan operon transcriptional antiterminator